jgi:WD40 repeat protein
MRVHRCGGVGKGPLLAIVALCLAGGLIGFGMVRLLKPADPVQDTQPSVPASPTPTSTPNEAHVVKIPDPTPTPSATPQPAPQTGQPQGELITGKTVDLNNLGQSDKLRANVLDLKQEEARTPDVWDGHTNTVTGVAYNDDGSLVVSVSGDMERYLVNGVPRPPDHSVRVWDARRGKQLRKLEGFPAPLDGISVSAGGRYVLFGDGGHWEGQTWVTPLSKAVHLFDILDGREIPYGSGADGRMPANFYGATMSRFQGLTGSIFASAFSPDMVRVLGASNEGELIVWNIGTAGRITRFRIDSPRGWFRGIYSAHFTGDGRYLVFTTDHRLWLVDAYSGRKCWCLSGHKDLIWASAVTDFKDGRGLIVLTAGGKKQPLSGGEFRVHARDFAIRVWSMESGRVLRTLAGHDPATRAVAFRPKTHHCLSAGEDSAVRLWDVDTGRLLRELGTTHGSILTLAVSPDGRHAVSGGNDCRVYHWFLPALAEDLVQAVLKKDVAGLKKAVADLDTMGADVRSTFDSLVKGSSDSLPEIAEHARHGLLSLRDLWQKGYLSVTKAEMQALGEQLKFSNNAQLAEMAKELRELN